MQGYVGPIEALTEGNRDFRRVLFTAGHMQLVLMALQPGEEIGSEIHATHDQFFRIEKGQGEIRLDGVRSRIGPGDAIIVPAGMRHNLINTGKRRLRLYTLYAPPPHADRLVEATKAEADRHEAERQAQAPANKGREAEPRMGALAIGGRK
jgi:mannose-6-phosphate isomerase-like protein (cupin superfamily)